MTQAFDKGYWESHWQQATDHGSGRTPLAHPYLEREIEDLAPGTALDAGCGEGAEAIWLADQGWQVTAADISAEALARAVARANDADEAPGRVRWIEVDLSTWDPGTTFDLVTTHYAHPAMPQLAFYERISDWVSPGGTLLIVGHLATPGAPDHAHGHERDGPGHVPPDEASVTAVTVTAQLDATRWHVATADEPVRTRTDPAGRIVQLHDVVVRATRRSRTAPAT
jgi:SAM-dependent methyltransferase